MRQFDLWLHVLAFELLLRAGAAAETLESELPQLVQGDRRRGRAEQASIRAVVTKLAAAHKLGTVSEELAYWDSRCESEFNLALDRARSALGFGIQLSLGVIVGILVVGLYLPIFQFAQLG
jgi:type II secretory pathway component PulF